MEKIMKFRKSTDHKEEVSNEGAAGQLYNMERNLSNQLNKYVFKVFDCASSAAKWVYVRVLVVADYISPREWLGEVELNEPLNEQQVEVSDLTINPDEKESEEYEVVTIGDDLP